MDIDDYTAVVLCGGAAERLGGIDKPLQMLRGRPLVAHVVECVAAQVEEVVIAANRSRDAYQSFADVVVDDGRHAGRGPLAGMAAGFEALRTNWLLCVPGDAPLLPHDLLPRLRQALARAGADVAVVHDGSGRQPLCSLLPRRLYHDLGAYLDSGGTAPRQWLARYHVAEADFADWPSWAWSLNTPDEWAEAERELGLLQNP